MFRFRGSEDQQLPQQEEPSPTASIVSILRDKSVDELRILLSDKDEYNKLLLSLPQVQTQNNIIDELQKESLHLARDNLEKELTIDELRNQCKVIRATELATAQEKLNALEGQKKEMLNSCSPDSFLPRLQEAMNKTDKESETLHTQLLDGEIEPAAFIQEFKKLRATYHKRELIHDAMKTPSP